MSFFGNLEWFENISYTYNSYRKILQAEKYNYFSKKYDIVGKAVVGKTNIQYPEGVRVALGFKIKSEECPFHEMCRRFELKTRDDEVLDVICRKIYRLNIKLV